MSPRKTVPFRVFIFLFSVLSLSWAFGLYVFSAPDRLWMFNRVMFIPGIVALLLRISERQGLRQITAPLLRRLDLPSILFAVGYPLAVIAGCALISLGLGLAHLTPLSPGRLVPHPTLFAFLVVLGEEYGWRGYLLPRLAAWRGLVAATAIVGLVWALWHAPFLFWLASRLGTAAPLKLCGIQMAAVFVIAFPFSYVYARTGSIIPPMIFHYVWNEYNPVILGNIYRNQPGLLAGKILTINGEGILGVVLGGLAALAFARRLRQSTLQREKQDRPGVAEAMP